MNSKLIKAGLAGTAALAVVAGGTTFAAWSDFRTTDASAEAGYLRINLSERQGTSSGVDGLNLAPGQNKYQYFYLASADTGNTPDGKLTATITNLVDTEDSRNCTTNSEAVAEGSAASNVDLGACGKGGELSQQVGVQVLVSDPVPNGSVCGNTGVNGVNYDNVPRIGTDRLSDREDVAVDLGTLNPGEGVCLRVEMSLPSTATNATQGDEASWDWRFDLVQA